VPLTQDEMQNVCDAIMRVFNFLGPFGQFEVSEQQMEDAGLHHLLGRPDGRPCRKTMLLRWHEGLPLFLEPILLILNRAPIELIDCMINDLRQMPPGVPMDGWEMHQDDPMTLVDSRGFGLLHHVVNSPRLDRAIVLGHLLPRCGDPNRLDDYSYLGKSLERVVLRDSALARGFLADQRVAITPALRVAIATRNEKALATLLECDRVRRCVLHVFAEVFVPRPEGAMAKAQELLSMITRHEGVNLNGRNADGKTPLHIAVEGGWLFLVKMLLDEPGIDLALADNAGNTPCDIARRNNHADLVQILEAHMQLREKRSA